MLRRVAGAGLLWALVLGALTAGPEVAGAQTSGAQTSGAQAAAAAAPRCAPDGGPVHLRGSVAPEDARTYRVVPFEVAAGTTRIEVSYDWSDLVADTGVPGTPVTGLLATVVDVGLWDADGYREPAGFRGWSGSRAGRVAAGQDPIVVQPDEASRGYRPGSIGPGTWWLDLGFAVVAPTGASWEVTITCTDPTVGAPADAEPVDAARVLDATAGWYHADLHVHGHHSAADAPAWDDIVDQARTAGLEVLPVTEYVTGQHWDELGPVQDRNPDVLLWPGREIITYFGHAIALGETRSVLEYRHGFEDVSMRGIQDATLADGALFGVAHPTFFPGPLTNLCRGCEYTLGDVTDWSRVDTIEVLTGPVLATPTDVGVPFDPGARIANPFLRTAVERWDELLQAGHRVTAVSGSDAKANEPPAERARRGIGSSATAIRADALSRPALAAGLRAGRAYIRSLGVHDSPALEVVATAPDGATAGIGDDLAAETAEFEVTVTGGAGDRLVLIRNGAPVGTSIAVTSDPFTTTIPIARDPETEGPLGTWVRVETIRAVEIVDGVALPDLVVDLPLGAPAEADVLRFPTTLANPVFLTGIPGTAPGRGGNGAPDGGAPVGGAPDGGADRPRAGTADPERPGPVPTAADVATVPLPVTGARPAPLIGLPLLVAWALVVPGRLARRRRVTGGRAGWSGASSASGRAARAPGRPRTRRARRARPGRWASR